MYIAFQCTNFVLFFYSAKTEPHNNVESDVIPDEYIVAFKEGTEKSVGEYYRQVFFL